MASLATPKQPAESSRKIGEYTLLEQLGRGANGTVYRVSRGQGGRVFALKIANRGIGEDSDQYANLRNEASLIGQLRHPYIAAVVDADLAGDQPYLVMEYVPGQTLAHFTSAATLLPIKEVLEIAFKCCNALDYTQRLGLVHGDIKPANIIRSEAGLIKLTDFGTAFANGAGLGRGRSKAGTPSYMAPEALQAKPLTFHADMFALGVTLYQLLTAHLPFAADTEMAILYKICHVAPAAPTALRPALPAAIDDLLEGMLAKSPTQRFRSWSECAACMMRLIEVVPDEPQLNTDSRRYLRLREHPLLKKLTDQEIWETLLIGEWKKYESGAVVFRQDSLGSAFYLFIGGDVGIYIDDVFIRRESAPSVIGELPYLRPETPTRSASIVTITRCTFFRIPNQALLNASVDLQLKFERAFTQVLIDRLHRSNSETVSISPPSEFR